MRRILKPIQETDTAFIINARELGAVGDGVHDDFPALQAAIEHAAIHELTLELPEGEYYLSDGLVADRVNLICRGARFEYHGERWGTPALRIKNNVNIFGKLYINAHRSTRNDAAERAPIAMGSYYTGEGSHNCYIEDVELFGGNDDSNGICITGDCTDIIIDRVTVPDGSAICRGVCIHWGNTRDHRNVANDFVPEKKREGYFHDTEKGTPLTHASHIHLGVVDCAGFKKVAGATGDADKAAVTICAASDISVDEIIMHDSCHALCVTGADLGFEYANDFVKKRGQRNIYVKKITGTALRSAGVLVLGYPWYIREARVGTQIRIDEMCVEAAEGNRDVGIALLGISKAEIGNATVKGFLRQGLYINRGSENIQVGTLNIKDVKHYAVTANMYSEDDGPSRNIQIGTVNIDCDSDGEYPAFNLVAVDDMKIGEVNIKKGKYSSLLDVTPECTNIRFERVDAQKAQLDVLVHSDIAIPEDIDSFFGEVKR